MAPISPILYQHLRLSGDYSDHTQRNNGWLEPDGVRASSTQNRAYVLAQASMTGPFVRALGTGAEPGLLRHVSGFFNGDTDGPTWADAAHLSTPHPCKLQPTAANIARAGMAAAAVGIVPGTVAGIVGGFGLGALTGARCISSHGVKAAIHTGVATGIYVGLTSCIVISLGLGVAGALAAYKVVHARAAQQRQTSRWWEDVSGGIALIPRVATALWTSPKRVTVDPS